MDILAVGGPRPPGIGGGGGWDFWLLAGFLIVFVLLLAERWRLTFPLVVVLAVFGSLVISELTHAWGVIPVWGGLLVIALSRNVLRGRSQRQV